MLLCSWPGVPPAFIAMFPPSNGIIAPVIQLEESEARSTARPIISLGWPSRWAGIPCKNLSSKVGSSLMRAVRPGLTIWAGVTQFTRTPRWLHSVLSSLVICTTAPIAILYAICPRPSAVELASEPIFIMEPRPWASIRSPAC